ncbi:MAG: hypothetical protein R8K48_02635 [Gallionella sp.]
MFFDVDDGNEVTRYGSEDTYKLDILILHAANDDFLVAENAAQKAATAIKAEFQIKLYKPFDGWRSIELSSCDAVSESVLSYQQFKVLKRWRLDHISLAADPQQPVCTE